MHAFGVIYIYLTRQRCISGDNLTGLICDYLEKNLTAISVIFFGLKRSIIGTGQAYAFVPIHNVKKPCTKHKQRIYVVYAKLV